MSYGRQLRFAPGDARAGEGDRTPIASLEGWSSTIELHPRGGLPESLCRGERIRTSDPLLPKQVRYQAAPRPAETGHEYNKGHGALNDGGGCHGLYLLVQEAAAQGGELFRVGAADVGGVACVIGVEGAA